MATLLGVLFFLGRQLCCPQPSRRGRHRVIIAVVVIFVYATSLAVAGVDPITVALLVSLAAGAVSSIATYRARSRRRAV